MKINEEANFPSQFGIGNEVSFVPMFNHQEKYGISDDELEGTVVAVRFSKSKVFYDVVDYYYGKLFDNVDSTKVNTSMFASVDGINKLAEGCITEGHSGENGPLDDVKDRTEAEALVRGWIRTDKNNGDGNYKKFWDVKWIGKTTEQQLDKEACKWEDRYIILGEIDGIINIAYWKRD